MYTRILTPLDGSPTSEQVIPFARSLAATLSLPMTLLHAVEPEVLTIPRVLNPSLHLEEMVGHRVRRATSYLGPISEGLQKAGVSVDSEIPQGEPASAIVESAAREAGTLIAMSSHGRSGLARWWMGSITDKVLHLTDNPLLVIRAVDQPQRAPENRFESVTVPVDGSELAEEILPHAIFLSRSMGLTIQLVQANPSRDEYYRSMSIGPNEVSRATPSYEDYIGAVDADSEAYLAEVKERLTQQGAPSVETHLLHGPAAESISDFAAATSNNLVAMTTHGRSGVGRLVLGSVAERVVRQSGDPVLLIRGGHGGEIPMTGAPALA